MPRCGWRADEGRLKMPGAVPISFLKRKGPGFARAFLAPCFCVGIIPHAGAKGPPGA